jgi:transcriptional regulator with XRE-family HTH domain
MMQGSLAMRLRVLRAERGLSLTEAAERAGIQRQTLALLERGERHPHDPTLAKIAKGYGVPVEDLLEEPIPLGDTPAKPEKPESGPERETYDFDKVRRALDEHVNRWEAKLASGKFARGELDEYVWMIREFLPAVGTAMQAERNELRERYGENWRSQGGERQMEDAVGRCIGLGMEIERVYKDRYGAEAIPGEAEIRELRESWRRQAG